MDNKLKKTIIDNLIKRAKGMVLTDEIVEIKYAIKESGEEIAVEKKVRTTKRTLPPDLSAILELLDNRNIKTEDDPDTMSRELDYKILCKHCLQKLILIGILWETY